MKLFGWLKGDSGRETAATAWRRDWAAAVDGADEAIGSLRQRLEALATPGADLELEEEMLDGLEQLREAQRAAAGGLPVVETHHRVIGSDVCHFTAPASLPADEHQAHGRLLLTSARAVFVGGGRTAAVPWHAVHEVLRMDRDVLLLRADRTPAGHFRLNTFADTLLCTFVAGRLRRAR